MWLTLKPPLQLLTEPHENTKEILTKAFVFPLAPCDILLFDWLVISGACINIRMLICSFVCICICISVCVCNIFSLIDHFDWPLVISYRLIGLCYLAFVFTLVFLFVPLLVFVFPFVFLTFSLWLITLIGSLWYLTVWLVGAIWITRTPIRFHRDNYFQYCWSIKPGNWDRQI